MPANKEDKIIKQLYTFWKEEYIAVRVYRFLSHLRRHRERSQLFLKLSQIEAKHANILQQIAKQYSRSFSPNFGLKIKTFFMKVLALFLPQSFILLYLEHDEKSAVISYSNFLSYLKDDPKAYSLLTDIIRDELHHESQLEEELIKKRDSLNIAKEAIYGMTDSLVEILALVIGLAGAQLSPLFVGLAGLISSIGGTFSMTSGAFLSSKSEKDYVHNKEIELNIKKEVDLESLKADLANIFIEKGVTPEKALAISNSLSSDKGVLVDIIRGFTVDEEALSPLKAATVTAIFYIIGAIPGFLPFFLAYIFHWSVITAAIIAIITSLLFSSFSGIFVSILTGVSIIRKVIENVLIIMGSTAATFTIGYLAKLLIGIEV